MAAQTASTGEADRSLAHRAVANDLALKSAVLYVLGHLLDLVTTYLLTPDLRHETNVLVSQLGLGWAYVLGSAVMTSVAMLLALFWMWRRLVRRLPPGRGAGYGSVYRAILYGGASSPSPTEKLAGAFLGVVCIVAYSVIAAKLLTCAWNLSVMATGATVEDFKLILLAKNALAAVAGLAMFFVFPYRLYQRI